MSNPNEPERPQHGPPVGPPHRPGDPQQQPAPRKRHWLLSAPVIGAVGFALGITIGAIGSGTAAEPVASESDLVPVPTATVTATATATATATITATATETVTAEPKPRPTKTVTVTAEPPEPEGPGVDIGDGIWLIGVDVQPGTYQSTDNSGCYWARLSGTSGAFDDILANANVDGNGVVTILGSDVAFESSGCNRWELIE